VLEHAGQWQKGSRGHKGTIPEDRRIMNRGNIEKEGEKNFCLAFVRLRGEKEAAPGELLSFWGPEDLAGGEDRTICEREANPKHPSKKGGSGMAEKD